MSRGEFPYNQEGNVPLKFYGWNREDSHQKRGSSANSAESTSAKRTMRMLKSKRETMQNYYDTFLESDVVTLEDIYEP